MRILLLGEASFVHTIQRKGFRKLGHDVVLMTAESKHLDRECDVDLRRNMKYGKLGGLAVLFKLAANLHRLVGNDIVQVHNYQFLPFRGWVNKLFFDFLKLFNKKVVKCCLCDDVIIFEGQARRMLAYSDTYIDGKPFNEDENRWRIEEQTMPEFADCCRYINKKADALLPCLYEYYVYYDLPEYHDKLYYMPLPMNIMPEVTVNYDTGTPVKVLAGIQTERDYLKGASEILKLVERIAAENPGKIEVRKVHDVPYNKYLRMIDDADVLIDQLYSYTPSMNSLAAMAHGTVVIGGGEEEYYRFIGEDTLRPIINVRPHDDEKNMEVLRATLLNPSRISDMKRQGMEFIRKHHDYVKVCERHIELYGKI